MSASELGRKIGNGDIDPIELTTKFLEEIKGHALNEQIYARLTEDRALHEAELSRSRAKNGTRKSVLDGVPVSWKDLFDTAGVATEAGSLLLKNRVPKSDSIVLKNATNAGLICLGKTHMSELAFSGLGLNPITSTPPCVNDIDAVPGGSSSGAAASVAFHLAAAGIGSDTGGSVRIPAAWNDLVGLKTTIGRLSVEGSVPLNPHFDTIGPLCRSVEDALNILGVLEGKKVSDIQEVEFETLKFMILKTGTFDDIHPKVDKGFNHVVDILKENGVSIEIRHIEEVNEVQEIGFALMSAGSYGTWQKEIEKSPELMFPEILNRFRSGKEILAVDYIYAWRRLRELRVLWMEKTSSFDAVIMPTSQILPPNLQRLLSDGEYYKRQNLLALKNTRIANLLGLSSLTIPTGFPSVGFMLMAKPNSEESLLSIGATIEKMLA
jgi:aspartyl-tRNA(Asn)/glutamyl-tRNA(Gln) amidotransferase subunit A